ncbi:hypothetical protein RIF29_29057 [Crotalaria pallida]|uniref:Uncharacterized protein n=1 Tax=Crotalaria pallida TaxID=3830 RepID=A0AAN9EDZ4_CROPI
MEIKTSIMELSSKQSIRGQNYKNFGIVIFATSPFLGSKRKEDDAVTCPRDLKKKEFEPNNRPMVVKQKLQYDTAVYTWAKGRQGDDYIQCRLDRALANASFLEKEPASFVNHLPHIQSDHAPIVIQLAIVGTDITKPPRMFRFEESWTFDSGTEATIKAAWQQAHGDGYEKIGAMKTMLKCLKCNTITTLRHEIIKAEYDLGSNSCWEVDSSSLMIFKELKDKHASLLLEEEVMWLQCSRALWLQHGDKNSKFFHRKETLRKETNTIKKIKREDGILVSGHSNIVEELDKFYVNLFSSSMPPNVQNLDDIIQSDAPS